MRLSRALATIGLALAGPLLARPPAARTTGFVPVPQGRLWYEAAGAGPALVLLHDGLLPSESWDEQVEPFARHFRVVRYDRRGYGRSESQAKEHSDVDDLRALLEGLRLERATLVGCSSGGGLVLDFALEHPERVAALVLVGPVVSGLSFSEHFRLRGLGNLAPAYVEGDKARAVANWAADAYITDARNTAARARLRALLERFPQSAQGDDSGARPPARAALGRLGELKQPALLITGASDIPDVHAHMGAIQAGLPQSERQVVERAGHLVHLEQPAEFNARVLDFLAPPGHVDEVLARLRGPQDAAAFDYDRAAALDVREAGSETRGEVRVLDLSYASPRGGRVPAYLVARPAARSQAGLLFLHHGQGDRKTFLEEAVELAGQGFAGLLVDAPDKRPGAPQDGPPFEAARDRAEIEQTVIDLRRGLDLLAARPEVDPRRLGYVGYSLGATMGARLLGVEPRLVASVEVAGFPALTLALSGEHRRAAMGFHGLVSAEQQRAYLAALAPLDGVRFLEGAPARPLLLQFARADEFIAPLDAALYARVGGASAESRFYDGGHFALGAGAPREDRRAFLLRTLAAR